MLRRTAIACLLGGVCALFSLPGSAIADETPAHHHDAGEKLGNISFPISCAPDSQKPFERGVALMHSFGYEEAETQFVELTQKDPACARVKARNAPTAYSGMRRSVTPPKKTSSAPVRTASTQMPSA